MPERNVFATDSHRYFGVYMKAIAFYVTIVVRFQTIVKSIYTNNWHNRVVEIGFRIWRYDSPAFPSPVLTQYERREIAWKSFDFCRIKSRLKPLTIRLFIQTRCYTHVKTPSQNNITFDSSWNVNCKIYTRKRYRSVLGKNPFEVW